MATQPERSRDSPPLTPTIFYGTALSLRHFAQCLERDLDAVIPGLTLPWNSGVVEGHVNRIKMLKRQMFGRAGFELLRKRVLLA
ncbi:hypothetical protein ACFVFJ_45550 [Streptomyces sp. NPDC057717]|uniref:hypothetical protein n=1 Tax=Streptomyces sp. NPDC057717 TaxID=3346224 RepID=UPI0036C18720